MAKEFAKTLYKSAAWKKCRQGLTPGKDRIRVCRRTNETLEGGFGDCITTKAVMVNGSSKKNNPSGP